MFDLNKYVTGEQNITRINEHGLKLELRENQDPMQSRKDTSTCWVGVDVQCEYDESTYDGNLEAYINDYCRSNLDCGIEDIIWVITDHYSVGQSMVFVVGDNDKGWVEHGIAGKFIYIKKETAILGHSHESFTMDDIISNTKNGLKEQVDEYNAWCNDEVFIGVLKVDQSAALSDTVQHVAVTETAIVNLDKGGEYMVSEMISDAVDSINAVASRTVTFTAKVSKKIDLKDSPTIKLIDQIKAKLDFKPALGMIKIDESSRTIKVTMLLATIPSFLMLCSYGRALTKQNIFRLMTSHVRRSGDQYDFESIDDLSLIDTLTDSETYSSWSNHLLIALLTMILDETKDFTFDSMDWQSKRTIGSNKDPVSYANATSQYIRSADKESEAAILLALTKYGADRHSFTTEYSIAGKGISTDGYKGLLAMESKLSLYNENKDIILMIGEKIATAKGHASLVDLLSIEMHDYHYGSNMISEVLKVPTVLNVDKYYFDVNIVDFLLYGVVTYIYDDIDDLHASMMMPSVG